MNLDQHTPKFAIRQVENNVEHLTRNVVYKEVLVTGKYENQIKKIIHFEYLESITGNQHTQTI